MHRYGYTNRKGRIALALAVLAAPPLAAAADPQWSALLALEDGGLAPEMLRVVADSETACLAGLSPYRGAVVIEPCQPAPSAITDPNDANRTGKGPKPAQPGSGGVGGSGGHSTGSGTGSAGGGAGGGGLGGW